MMALQLDAKELAKLKDEGDDDDDDDDHYYCKKPKNNENETQSKMTTEQDGTTLSCHSSVNVITLSEAQVPVDQLDETLQQLLTRYASHSDVFVKISEPTYGVIIVGTGREELESILHTYQTEDEVNSSAELVSQCEDENNIRTELIELSKNETRTGHDELLSHAEASCDTELARQCQVKTISEVAKLTTQTQNKTMANSDGTFGSEVETSADEELTINDMEYEVSVESESTSNSGDETTAARRKRKKSTICRSSPRRAKLPVHERHTCVECGQVFSAQRFLVAHLRKKHSDGISTLWINRIEHNVPDWTNPSNANEGQPALSVQCHQQLQSESIVQLQTASQHPATSETCTFASPQIRQPATTDETRQKTNRSSHQPSDEVDGASSKSGRVKEFDDIIDNILDVLEDDAMINILSIDLNSAGFAPNQSNDSSDSLHLTENNSTVLQTALVYGEKSDLPKQLIT